MRKRLIIATPENIQTHGEGWLDVEHAAMIKITSEDKDFPIEAAFISGDPRGWRAETPGNQTIRLIFDQPQRLRCISLVFVESESERTQEFVLRWSGDCGLRNSLQLIQPNHSRIRITSTKSRPTANWLGS